MLNQTRSAAMLLVDWAEAYCLERDLSHRSRGFYRGGARCFEKWAGEPLTIEAAAERLNRYLDHLAATKNRYTAASCRNSVRALLRSAAAEGLISLPVKLRPIKTPEHRPRAFAPDELERLIEHANPVQLAAIMLAYDTGFRRSDLFKVRWDQVIGEGINRRIAHTASKTGRQEVRRLRQGTLEALEAIRRDDDDRLLPLALEPKRTPRLQSVARGDGYSFTGWRKQWRALGRRAGVDTHRRGLQAIRRTGATLSKRAGGSASDYLGHSPHSQGLAARYYLDPALLDTAPPLPPALDHGLEPSPASRAAPPPIADDRLAAGDTAPELRISPLKPPPTLEEVLRWQSLAEALAAGERAGIESDCPTTWGKLRYSDAIHLRGSGVWLTSGFGDKQWSARAVSDALNEIHSSGCNLLGCGKSRCGRAWVIFTDGRIGEREYSESKA